MLTQNENPPRSIYLEQSDIMRNGSSAAVLCLPFIPVFLLYFVSVCFLQQQTQVEFSSLLTLLANSQTCHVSVDMSCTT
jgi:hypothetical protein